MPQYVGKRKKIVLVKYPFLRVASENPNPGSDGITISNAIKE